jgi:hypothetical protein
MRKIGFLKKLLQSDIKEGENDFYLNRKKLQLFATIKVAMLTSPEKYLLF